jgi:hypothetical protein
MNSVANLAKLMLGDLDRSRVATSVPTLQLELILTTLVELAETGANRELADKVRKNHMGLMTDFSDAVLGER